MKRAKKLKDQITLFETLIGKVKIHYTFKAVVNISRTLARQTKRRKPKLPRQKPLKRLSMTPHHEYEQMTAIKNPNLLGNTVHQLMYLTTDRNQRENVILPHLILGLKKSLKTHQSVHQM